MSPMEQALRGLLERVVRDVFPHVRDTGHNAVDREASEAITAVKAALTAALPAPGDAGDWVVVPRVMTMPMAIAAMYAHRVERWTWDGVYAAMLSAAPHPPVSLGEISQAQAQAMREALEKIATPAADAGFCKKHDLDWMDLAAYRRDIARAALSASPLPAPATPGGPDAE